MFKYLIIFLLQLTSCIEVSKECSLTYYKEVESYTLENSRIFKIRYFCQNNEIEAFLLEPKLTSEKTKLPMILYNRGGNRDYGSINLFQLKYLDQLVSHGFVVLASQYRGNLSSEGVDEYGGKDIEDLLCLIELSKEFKQVDQDRIGALGFSRGGMMSYLLAQKTDRLNAIATVGAPSNLFQSSKDRPRLYDKVYKELIGDTINNRKEFINRSAVFWSDSINAPMLIIHGDNDKRVSFKQSERLKDSLEKNNKPHKFILIEKGNHSISNRSLLRDSIIVQWFKKHL